jgi:nicotinate dehydrogenase subunit A
MANDLSINVNGRSYPVEASPDTRLLYVLSNGLSLRGPRFGCGLAQCVSCSVLLDGVEVRSCQTPVATVAGKPVTTLEGLSAWYAGQADASKIARLGLPVSVPFSNFRFRMDQVRHFGRE